MTKNLATLIAVLLLISAGASLAQSNPQCPDITYNPAPVPAIAQSSNPQYFSYNASTIALVGLSSEYLCHIAQPGTFTIPAMGSNPAVTVTPDNSYCTWANYRSFIDRLAQSGLNVFQVWVSLNQSVAKARYLAAPQAPYPSEQPFTYNSITGQWSISSPNYDATFFQRLQCVVAYAATKNVMVEVTLFDPWSTRNVASDWTLGPWADAFNVEPTTYFTQRQFFASFNGTGKSDPLGGPDAHARSDQDQLVQQVVGALNPYPNFYWEIANEPDLGGFVTGSAAMLWEDHVAHLIRAAETGKKTHLIGVNVFTSAALASLTDSVTNPDVSQSQIVSSHYVTAGDPGYGGGIALLRAEYGQPNFTNRLFGFNETKASPNPSIPSSVRSEAWEFMVSGGGLYDNYNLSYQTSPGVVDPLTNKIFNQLGILQQTLKGLGPDLVNMHRDGWCGPLSNCWIRNVRGYGSAETPYPSPCGGVTAWQGYTYWAAMHSPTNYLFYQHHSRLSSLDGGGSDTRYVPPPAGCPPANTNPPIYQEANLKFRPVQSGSYKAKWIEPATGIVKSCTPLGNLTAGVDYALPASQTYSYDVALWIQAGSTCP